MDFQSCLRLGHCVGRQMSPKKQERAEARSLIWCISQLVIGESAFPDLRTGLPYFQPSPAVNHVESS